MIQILYTPGEGNTEKMAEEITKILPGGEWEKEIITLDTEIKPAELYLIGFGIRRNTLPYPVLQLLDQLENKRVAFFASGALGGVDAYKTKIESQILSFLPDRCDYQGLFVCAGSLSREGMDFFREQLNGNEAALRQLLARTVNHPNTEDMEQLGLFIRRLL